MAFNVRRLAAEGLVRLQRENSYSNVVLDAMLKAGGPADGISPADQALLSRLFYGVLERMLTLDYIISTHSSVKLKKMHPTVLVLLRLGCYQLVFMDKIPASAAVNETVKLAKAMKQVGSAGFVNAVLRAIERDRGHLYDDLDNDLEGISIRTSCPVRLIRLWEKAYGRDTAFRLAEYANTEPPNTIRVNTLKITADDFEAALKRGNIPFARHSFLPACYDIEDPAGMKRLAEIDQSCYYHQDAASQYACKALSARPDERIADVCAAPGGKSLTCAQMMENRGEIMSFDIHPFKCEAMEKRARQMGATIIKTAVKDASKPCPDSMKGRFDRVVCDVPCSGLGVIRRRPEIRYKPLDGYKDLPGLQYEILHQSSETVRPGGVLQYSTCTLDPAENQQVAERFLREHPEFSPRVLPIEERFTAMGIKPSHMITLFPHIHNTDGFFIAGFIKKD